MLARPLRHWIDDLLTGRTHRGNLCMTSWCVDHLDES